MKAEVATEEISKEMLLEMMKINLEHARHVENERITLNSIFTAIVAGVLAFTLETATQTPEAGVVSTLVLLLACVLSMLLNKRWSDVFEGHTQVAKRLYEQCFGGDADENIYYYNKHKNLKGPKLLMPLLRIRTRNLFAYFYTIVFTSLLCLLGYYIYLC